VVPTALSASEPRQETGGRSAPSVPAVEWTIQNGMTVQLEYTLTVEDRTVDSTEHRGPLIYVHGRGELIPGLERRLTGLSVGDELEVAVSPEEGYGLVDLDLFVEMPRSRMPRDVAPKIGAVVRGVNEDGTSFNAVIASMSDGAVTLDLNHPLAGKTLQFHVRVAGITPPK